MEVRIRRAEGGYITAQPNGDESIHTSFSSAVTEIARYMSVDGETVKVGETCTVILHNGNDLLTEDEETGQWTHVLGPPVECA